MSTPTETTPTHALLEQGRQLVQAVGQLVEAQRAATVNTKRAGKAKVWFYSALAVGTIAMYGAAAYRFSGYHPGPSSAGTIAVIPVNGEISSDSDASAAKLVPLIKTACSSTKIDSLLLQISSPGGSPSEAERIGTAIDACRHGLYDKHPKRVVALIDGLGASGAYLIAIHADKIYAGRYSLVGSIGAIIRIPDASAMAKTLGVQEHTYRSSPGKGGPSLLTSPNPSDDTMFQALVVHTSDLFVSDVAKFRKATLTVDPKTLATGEVWTADKAKQLGLIDGIADREELGQTEFKDRTFYDYEPSAGLGEWGIRSLIHSTADALRRELQ